MAAGTAVVAGGVGVALVELLRFPKGAVWVVVALTIALVAAIRALTAPRR